MSARSSVVQRRKFTPALPVKQLELFASLPPAFCGPQDIRTKPYCFVAVDICNQFKRQIVASKIRHGARLKKQALVTQIVRQIRDARRLQGCERPVGLAVHEIHDRKARRDLCAGAALQAVVDLVLKQLGGLIEKIDGHQAIGKPSDHLVAASPDRCQFAEIVEQAKSFDGWQRLSLAAKKKTFKRGGGFVLDLACHIGIGMGSQRGPHDVERVAIAAIFGVEMGKNLEALGFGLITAPYRGERFEIIDDVLASHAAGRQM